VVPVRFVVVVVGALLCGAPAWAQQPKPPANDDCLTCHNDPDVKRSDGSSVSVVPNRFAESVHGPLSCVDCHADLAKTTEFPHPDKLAPVNCASCHDDPAKLLGDSVHGRRPHGGGTPLACVDCHGKPHEIRPASDPTSATNKLNTAATCGRCHGDTQPVPSMRGPAVSHSFADSIHGQALAKAGLIVAPTCTDCHTSHAVAEKTSPKSPVFRTNVPATCGKCHAGIEHEYSDSVHAKALRAGNAGAAQCASCHTAHAISRTEGDAFRLSAVQRCGNCHAEALATYRDTFHGQVTRLGFAPVAKCEDCHRPHGTFAPSDPRSSVATINLIATCSKCHTGANANFVKYQPHANQHDPKRLPQLYYAARFMDVLLLGVFTFFGLHTVLWFVRERHPDAGDTPRKDDRA